MSKEEIKNCTEPKLVNGYTYKQLLETIENAKKTVTKEITKLQQESNRLSQQIAEFKKIFADCDTCKRTCDIGNCCKFGSEYIPDVEKIHDKDKQLVQAKEILKRLMDIINHDLKCLDTMAGLDVKQKAEQFLKEGTR